MATDIFKLLGTISVDTTDFINKINTAISKVNELSNAINGVGSVSANVNVGTKSGSTSGTGTGTTNYSQLTPSYPPGSTENEDNGTTVNVDPVISTGGKGWTVAKGVISNVASNLAMKAGTMAIDFLKDGWGLNLEKEKAAANYATLLGISTEEGTQFVNEIEKFALDTPLDFSSTLGLATRMLAVGIQQEDLIDTLWMLGDMTLGDTANMSSAAKALTDTRSKQKLYAQEAYQFVNANVPIWSLLEQLYASDGYSGENKGLTAMDLSGNLNNGITIPYEDVYAAFQLATSPGGSYYNAMLNMMDSGYGKQQRIDENSKLIGANIVKPAQALYNGFIADVILDYQDLFIDITGEAADALIALPETISNNSKTFLFDWLMLYQHYIKPHTIGGMVNTLVNGSYSSEPNYNYLSSGEGPAYSNLTAGNREGLGVSYSDYYDQGRLVAETTGMMRAWNKEVSAAMEAVWDSYRTSVMNGTPIDVSTVDALITVMEANLAKGGYDEETQTRLATEQLYAWFNVLTKLSPYNEDIPPEWYLYAQPEGYAGSEAFLPHGRATSLMNDEIERYVHNYLDTSGPNGLKNRFLTHDWYDIPETDGIGGSVGGFNTMFQMMTAQMETTVANAVREGMSGVTITGDVTTGNVVLNEGTLVGVLTPKINLQLGIESNRSSRG